jgi:hypothetical protein
MPYAEFYTYVKNTTHVTFLGKSVGKEDQIVPAKFDFDDDHLILSKLRGDKDRRKHLHIKFKSDFTTEDGDCGRIYVTDSGRILGMHVGQEDGSQAPLLCALHSEVIERATIPEEVVVASDILSIPQRVNQALKAPTVIGHECVGKVDPAEFPAHTNDKTDIVPSRIANPELWPDNKVPTTTTPERMAEALKLKFGFEGTTYRNRHTIPNEDVNKCVDLTVDALPKRDYHKLTWHEVLNSGIDYNTSAGMWGPSKRDYVEFEEGVGWKFSQRAYDYVHPILGATLIAELEFAEQAMAQKARPFCYWTVALKKELTAKAHKTRIFECPPLHIYLLSVRYFGDFKAGYIDGWKQLRHALGVDPEALHAHLYEQLRNCDARFDLDFSNFDVTIHPASYDLILRICNRIYKDGPDDDQIRATLLDEFQSNFAIAHTQYGVHLYYHDGGNPSGNYLTSYLNSEANKLANYSAFSAMCGGLPPLEIVSHLTLCVCGDDLVAGTSGVRNFSLDEYAKRIAHFGYRPTPASKEGDFKILDLDQLTFLKRGFSYYHGTILGPIDPRTIFQLLNWTKKKLCFSDDQLLSDCHEAAAYAVHYGPEYYDDLCDQIDHALRPLGLAEDFSPPSFPLALSNIRHKQNTLLNRTVSVLTM